LKLFKWFFSVLNGDVPGVVVAARQSFVAGSIRSLFIPVAVTVPFGPQSRWVVVITTVLRSVAVDLVSAGSFCTELA
ncbi:hypothetical protein A2U01_0098181, partial [Trifolium medium]|nr:hypothetical protein [Trifolium medium]